MEYSYLQIGMSLEGSEECGWMDGWNASRAWSSVLKLYYHGESQVLMFIHSPLDGCIVQPIEVIFVKSVDGLSAVLLMAVHNQLCNDDDLDGENIMDMQESLKKSHDQIICGSYLAY